MPSRLNPDSLLSLAHVLQSFNNGDGLGESTIPLNWNTSSAKDMLAMFFVALSFNQPIPWDTSNVEEMSYMFALTEAFNQDITSWDVGSVEHMVGMFQDSEVFNQDLSGWNVAAVTECLDFALDANPAWTVDLWPNFVSCSP